jgi:bifunctional oligoribonuclease and PAP phosphatase NrnA
MSINWPRFVEVIKAHQRILLVSHIRPDCDALGSELGMAGILDSLGKRVRIVNGQPTPPNYQFIDPHRRIKAINVDTQPAELADIELLMILDTSAWAQLGPMGDVVRGSQAKKIVLDHHVSSDDLGAETFKNVEAEATGRLVLEAAQHLGVRLTPEIATPLFAAIATDTGWFRFASTRGDTYRAAGALVDAGARPPQIWNSLYEQDTLARLNLTGCILARAKTELDGRLIHTAVFQTDFKAAGAIPSDTEDIINMTLNVGGTQMAVIMVEQPSGDFKISFRSRSQVDCSKLAEQFGGGGHKAAAGAFVKGPFTEAQSKILAAVRAAIQS